MARRERETPTRVFTLGDLDEAVHKGRAVGLGDATPVYVQTRRGRRRRRFVSEARLVDVDWLDPADNERVLIVVARAEWRRRYPHTRQEP
jgi:hypothetical protein